MPEVEWTPALLEDLAVQMLCEQKLTWSEISRQLKQLYPSVSDDVLQPIQQDLLHRVQAQHAVRLAGADSVTFSVEVTPSFADTFQELLEDLKATAGMGHTFRLVVDPQAAHPRQFEIDGDGADHIKAISREALTASAGTLAELPKDESSPPNVQSGTAIVGLWESDPVTFPDNVLHEVQDVQQAAIILEQLYDLRAREESEPTDEQDALLLIDQAIQNVEQFLSKESTEVGQLPSATTKEAARCPYCPASFEDWAQYNEHRKHDHPIKAAVASGSAATEEYWDLAMASLREASNWLDKCVRVTTPDLATQYQGVARGVKELMNELGPLHQRQSVESGASYGICEKCQKKFTLQPADLSVPVGNETRTETVTQRNCPECQAKFLAELRSPQR